MCFNASTLSSRNHKIPSKELRTFKIPNRWHSVVQYFIFFGFRNTPAKEVNFINVFLYICYCSAMEGSDAVKPYQSKIKIWFETTERAEMVRQCMEVDEELQPARLVKEMHVEGSYLVM
jgi:hypothetical protein